MKDVLCYTQLTFGFYITFTYLADAYIHSDVQLRKQGQPVPAATEVKGPAQGPVVTSFCHYGIWTGDPLATSTAPFS